MVSNWKSLLTNIANRYFRKARRSQPKRTRLAPRVEHLEDRLAPAVYNVATLNDDYDASSVDQASFNALPASQRSLRNAINAANQDGEFSTINLKTNKTYNLTIAGSDEEANVDGDLDILIDDGLRINGAGSTVRNAGADERIFHIVDGEDVNFQNIKIRLGDARNNNGDGGGVYSPVGGNTLVFNKVTLSDNVATVGGGLCATSSGPITFTNCTITNNEADDFAGGLIFYSVTGNINISGTTISNNDAVNDTGGAGFASCTGNINITKCIVDNNTAAVDDGGGFYFNSNTGIIAITDCDIRNNDAGDVGGGIFATSNADLRISRTQVRANTADDDGGGLFATNTDLIIHRSTFDHNTAANSGGGAFLGTLVGTITNSTFGYNQADDGGAFFISNAGVDFDSCTIAYNYADTSGSAFFLTAGAVVTIENCIIAKNEFAPGQFAGADDPISNGHNLLSFDDTAGNVFSGPVDLQGSAAAPLNPGLSALGYWNGGTTKTFGLLSTIKNANGVTVRNKAINNGLTGLPTDQNGAPRGALPDIGAYEKPGQG